MDAKRFEHVLSLERDGSMRAEGGPTLAPDESWTPEHLLLAAVARCTLKSLRFYASSARVEGSAEAASVVTRRSEDGRYAVVEVEVIFDVEIEPEPPAEELRSLLEQAARGCFVGNSLTAKPRYVWRVNGRHVEAAE